jgi:hypothetical protein
MQFKESADGFRAAGERYARAIAPPPPALPPSAPTPGPSQPQSPHDAIASYKRAIETKDLALLRRVVPGLTDADVRRIQDSFEQAESIEVNLKTDEIKLSGSVAYESRFSFILVRTPAGWHIQALN